MRYKLEDVKLENVKNSEFGCVNCLWVCVECKDNKNFLPDIYEGIPTCKNYTYYD